MQDKIRQLHPTPQPAQAQPVTSPAAVRRAKVHKRRLAVLCGTLAVVCGLGGYQLMNTQAAIQTKSQALSTAKAELKQTKAQKATLKVKIDQLNNQDYLGKLVRERYLMSKKGEIVFSLPAEQTDTSSTR